MYFMTLCILVLEFEDGVFAYLGVPVWDATMSFKIIHVYNKYAANINDVPMPK